MPLPFIIGGLAIAAAGYGAKKAYDGHEDKDLAERIIQKSKQDYDDAKAVFDKQQHNADNALEKLGTLQLTIGSDFAEFQRITAELLDKVHQAGHKDLKLDLPQHRLNQIEALSISAVSALGTVAGGAVAGVAAAYATYGGVMALGAASTGTAISALSGAAASNAALAALGGGSLAAGGFGMVGGTAVLGGAVAAPILAIAGWAYAKHGEAALQNAYEASDQTDEAINKLEIAGSRMVEIAGYAQKIYAGTNHIYQIFKQYFE